MRRARILAAAVAVMGLLVGCSAGSTTQSSPADGTSGGGSSLSIAFAAEPASLDFTKTDGAAIPQVLLYNIYETLVKLDQNGDVVPALATKWTVSKDRTTYTFTLAKGVKFSDGHEFTAADAAFSINRVKSDWTISLKAAMDVVKSAKALSPTSLRVTLKQPSNGWLYSMTSRIGAMMYQGGVAHLATKPIGTGPWLLDTWNRGDSILLKANPDYWGEAPSLSEVTFKYFKDPTAMNNALLSGTVQVIGNVTAPDALDQFENNDKYDVIEGTTNGEVVLSMNNSKPPFDSLQARQAVRYAIDHQALVDACWGGRGELIGGMVPPTDPWYQDLTKLYPYDPTKARQLVQQSGAASTTVRLRLPTLPYATSCGQVVQSDLKKVGFDVKLDQLEFPAAWLTQVFTNADYNLSIVAHVEPRDIGAVFGNPDYYPRYHNTAVQQIFAQADSAPTDQYVADMKKFSEEVSKDAASDFLFLLPNLIVADSTVQGLPENAVSESFDLTGVSTS